jgi:hypothetical protein
MFKTCLLHCLGRSEFLPTWLCYRPRWDQGLELLDLSRNSALWSAAHVVVLPGKEAAVACAPDALRRRRLASLKNPVWESGWGEG